MFVLGAPIWKLIDATPIIPKIAALNISFSLKITSSLYINYILKPEFIT